MMELKDFRIAFYTYKLKERSKQLWSDLIKDLIHDNDDHPEQYSLLQLVAKAKEEWLDAREFFEEVTEPELVDHAIYRIQAAEKKYMYLLKTSQQEGLINTKIRFKY